MLHQLSIFTECGSALNWLEGKLKFLGFVLLDMMKP